MFKEGDGDGDGDGKKDVEMETGNKEMEVPSIPEEVVVLGTVLQTVSAEASAKIIKVLKTLWKNNKNASAIQAFYSKISNELLGDCIEWLNIKSGKKTLTKKTPEEQKNGKLLTKKCQGLRMIFDSALLIDSNIISSVDLADLWNTYEGLARNWENVSRSFESQDFQSLLAITEVLLSVYISRVADDEELLNLEGLSSSSSSSSSSSLLSSSSSGNVAMGGEGGECDFRTKLKRVKAVINFIFEKKPDLVDSDKFKVLLKYPTILNFQTKRTYFKRKIKERDGRPGHHHHHYGRMRLEVNRDRLFEDSYDRFMKASKEDLKGPMNVKYQNEDGYDAGGLTRDWFSSITKEMFNPNYALFIKSDDGCYQPNSNSGINSNHLSYFEFCGRVVAKALYESQSIDVHFTRSFFKLLLGYKIVWKDLEAVDQQYFRNITWLLENNVDDLNLFFVIDRVGFGRSEEIELKENGSSIRVIEANKLEYVQLRAEWFLFGNIREQIERFITGFNTIIPRDAISIFTPEELELMICGIPTISVDDMRQNTELQGYSWDSPVIKNFFKLIRSFDNEELALLLQFITGSCRLPVEGFRGLRADRAAVKILRTGDTSRLPVSHTCFNQLDLPDYKTYEELAEKLLTAIKETSTFGII